MGVVVTKADYEDPRDAALVEVCLLCRKFTHWWWGNGCAPLCCTCAQFTTHKHMVKLAKEMNFGPIPEMDTTAT